MGKLKPKWMKTDIPKRVKVELWLLMKDNPTFVSWTQAISKYDFNKEDDIHLKMSNETYKALKYEIEHMPSEEVETLPKELQFWIEQLPKRKEISENINKKRITTPIRDEDNLGSERAQAIKKHDIEIFNRSNSIMSEESLLDFLWPLDGGPPIYYYKKAEQVGRFLEFFSFEGNQYMDQEVIRLCNNLCDSLRKLGAFLSDEFRPPPGPGVSSWARLLPGELSHAYYSEGQDPEEEPEIYWVKFNELQKLKDNCILCLQLYRAYIRDTLFQ